MNARESLTADPSLPHALSVSELTLQIKAVMEGSFPSIWVAGEISGLTRAAAGHLYFTLKDDRSQISGIIWQSTAARLKTEIREGLAVLCQGSVEVYPPRGRYQLIVRSVQPQGLGALQQAFQKLQEKLNAEGLFAAERKRRVPRFPRRIALLTSPSGAAIVDFLESASHRWTGLEIVVVPVLVQGTGSAESIVGGIRAANRLNPDVIVITRGGGSLEDLWSFNEEAVVRAVADSAAPTVSAVGHEVDITLCDLAADLRALTPTDGATKVLPDAKLVNRSVTDLYGRLRRAAQRAIDVRRARADSLASRSVLRKPHQIIQNRYRMLDELEARVSRAMDAKIRLAQSQLSAAAASLSALSPLNVLTRGYSVTFDAQGQAITDAAQVNDGDTIRTRLHQGELESVVKRVSSRTDDSP